MISLGWDSAVRAKGRGRAASEETERQLPRTGAAVGYEVSRVGRPTVYNRTPRSRWLHDGVRMAMPPEIMYNIQHEDTG